MEMLMIRNMMWNRGGDGGDGETAVLWLPNELMFEIFRALFNLYRHCPLHHQQQPQDHLPQDQPQ